MANDLIGSGFLIDLVLLVLVLAVTLGPLAYRMFAPIPASDRAAIQDYLASHSQTLVKLERRAFGGPWHRNFGSLPYQGGRPYRAFACEADGREWLHEVAVDGRRRTGDPRVKERINGVWTAA